MARSFNVPDFYKGSLVTDIKLKRQEQDPKKKDLAPSSLFFNSSNKSTSLKINLARHFGFCFGVENAIETAYRVVKENPEKKIFLISEMIHNPRVNKDLNELGVRFLSTTAGERLIDFKTLTPEDIIIVPAFGATKEIVSELESLGLDPLKNNATCPFVEKVWKRSKELGKRGFSIIIHGKVSHEETKATLSNARQYSPCLIVQDLAEAKEASEFIKGNITEEEFFNKFSSRISEGFNPKLDLLRIGVVNQTTMLASDTLEISSMFKNTMLDLYGEEKLNEHFADTRDTLCYATYENQTAVSALREIEADFAIVVGGYKSSNSSHLVELLEEKMPTYFIQDAEEIISKDDIRHFSLSTHAVEIKDNWLPIKDKITVNITSGASCPDKIVDEVIERIKELTLSS